MGPTDDVIVDSAAMQALCGHLRLDRTTLQVTLC